MPDNNVMSVPAGFFRFVAAWRSGSKQHKLGVLRSTGYLLESQETTYDDERTLRELVLWFNRNLTAPKRLGKVYAIFWFKPHVAEETELWSRLTALARLLQKYHYRVEIISTTRPGKVVYDDDAQIAAVPFNDTFEVGSVATIDRSA